MDRRGLLMFSMAVIMTLSLSGCRAIWYANLAEEDDIDGWVLTGGYNLTGQGLTLEDHNCASPPFSWTGDFVINLEFLINADEENWTYGSIWVGDRVNWLYSDAVGTFFSLGYGITDNWKVWTQKSPTEKETVESASGIIPEMKNGEWNTWQFEKRGQVFSMSMNGEPYAIWTEKYYDSETFTITLSAENEGVNKIIFGTVKVYYEEGCMAGL